MSSLRAFAKNACSYLLAPALICIAAWSSTDAAGQTKEALQRLPANQQVAFHDKLNSTTAVIATGHPTTTYFAMSHDIASIVSGSDGMRLLPLSTEGGIGTLRDLLFLRGVDLAITPANVLIRAKETDALGPLLNTRVAYITRLYNEDVHLIAGQSINTFNELRGKKVAVPQHDENAAFTVRDLMEHLEVEVVKMPAGEALAATRSGEIAAVLLIGSKPMPLVSELPKDGSLRLINVPFAPALEEGYVPSAFRADDYPSLIPPGIVVEGVAVSAVLVAATKDRDGSSQRLAKLVPNLLGALSQRPVLNPHSGWGQLNLAAPLQGWNRHPAAEEWLRSVQQEQSAALQRTFDAFLREKMPANAPELSPAQRKKLFEEFVRWTRKSVGEAETTRR